MRNGGSKKRHYREHVTVNVWGIRARLLTEGELSEWHASIEQSIARKNGELPPSTFEPITYRDPKT